jgi:hypothetical protein
MKTGELRLAGREVAGNGVGAMFREGEAGRDRRDRNGRWCFGEDRSAMFMADSLGVTEVKR